MFSGNFNQITLMEIISQQLIISTRKLIDVLQLRATKTTLTYLSTELSKT